MRSIVFLALAASLVGCVAPLPTMGVQPGMNWSNAGKVTAGMTETEVVNLVGKPYETTPMPDGSRTLVWLKPVGLGQAEVTSLVFKEGRAVGDADKVGGLFGAPDPTRVMGASPQR